MLDAFRLLHQWITKHNLRRPCIILRFDHAMPAREFAFALDRALKYWQSPTALTAPTLPYEGRLFGLDFKIEPRP